MRRSCLIIPLISLILVFLLAAGVSGFWFYKELTTPYYGTQTSEVFIIITPGTTTSEMADLLVQKGILHTQLPFTVYLRWTSKERRLQAGEYRFNAAATPTDIAKRLIRGDVYFRSITIPEGLTAQETIELLAENGFGNLGEMRKALLHTDWIQKLDPQAQNLEGYLFPETYHFSRSANSAYIIKTMVEQFQFRFVKITGEYSLPNGWSTAQIVTLASLIEKEASKSEERPLVASVLTNRLKKKIPLACDPTIIYALKLAGRKDNNIRKADLSMQSPYNTYIHSGLPPTPIANPGEDSLRAALNPAQTEYFYYVSRNDGTHHFSKDYRSHLRAVAKYQKSPARGAPKD